MVSDENATPSKSTKSRISDWKLEFWMIVQFLFSYVSFETELFACTILICIRVSTPRKQAVHAQRDLRQDSGENNRTIGRPKVNSLINELMNSLIKRRRFWAVICKK